LATSYECDVVSSNLSKSAFFKAGWVTLSGIFRRKERHPPTTVGVKKTRVIALSCDTKIHVSAVQCLVLSQSMRVTDKRTDRQTELRQPAPL